MNSKYFKFFPGKVALHPSLDFLPKVVSRFHLSQEMVLPVFFPYAVSVGENKLHTLDLKIFFII